MGWWKRRFYAGGRLFDRRRLIRFWAVLLVAAMVIFTLASAMRLKPLLERMATAKVSNTVSRVVSEAVDETIRTGEIQYSDLVSFEKDMEGRITALHSNMAACNRLQSAIIDMIVARIGEVSSKELSIPIGNLTGSALLSGRGPRIQVRMESMGSSTAYFKNEFASAGINQTKHQIVLHVDVYVTILLPGITTATKVSNAITVAETVIVGSVPQSYTYFAPEPSSADEDIKDYILNNA